MTETHLLFVSYGGGHIAMQLPVALRARDAGYRVTVLALTTAAKAVVDAGLDCVGYNDLWSYAASDAAAYGEVLCPNADCGGPVSIAETKAYHGINFSELVAEVGESEAYSKFEAHGRHAFLPAKFMSRVLRGIRPDVVIASNSPRSEQAAILAARELAIPAICLVDLFALQEYKWIARPAFADKICVLNEAVRQFFIAHGRSGGELTVTGNPAFDPIILPETISSGHSLRRSRGWDDGKINVLWASQVEPLAHPFDDAKGDPMLPRKIENILREVISERNDMRLVVRYHPNENIDFAPGLNVDFSPRAEPLHALLHAVDIVVVTGSTVGLEAYIAGRPVVSVDLSIFTADAPFSAMGIATGVSTLNELRQFMQNYTGDRQQISQSKRTSIVPPPRYATEAVLNVIKDVACLG